MGNARARPSSTQVPLNSVPTQETRMPSKGDVVATAEEIADFRLVIGEPDETTYSDAYLSALLDFADSSDAAALTIWTQKAAAYAGMVDTTESGSSRKLSQLQDQALKMVAHFGGLIAVPDEPESLVGYSYTLPIVRP